MAKTTVAKTRGLNPRRRGKPRTAPKPGAFGNDGERTATTFSERKSIDELAAEQGTKPTRLEDILGKGADLWESDQELEQFVDDIYARRKEDREPARQ